MDGARNFADRRVWAAFRLERAGLAVALTGAINDRSFLVVFLSVDGQTLP
jgi:hypothetical protein